jgi:ABC-type transporter Mla subunit MlaD
MGAKTIDDILGNQGKFLAKIRRLSDTTGEKVGLEPDDVLKDTAELIDSLKQRLEATAAARDAALSRFDATMQHYQGLIRRLERDLKDNRQRLQKAGGQPRKPVAADKEKPASGKPK